LRRNWRCGKGKERKQKQQQAQAITVYHFYHLVGFEVISNSDVNSVADQSRLAQ
jgi:hypothetical protein